MLMLKCFFFYSGWFPSSLKYFEFSKLAYIRLPNFDDSSPLVLIDPNLKFSEIENFVAWFFCCCCLFYIQFFFLSILSTTICAICYSPPLQTLEVDSFWITKKKSQANAMDLFKLNWVVFLNWFRQMGTGPTTATICCYICLFVLRNLNFNAFCNWIEIGTIICIDCVRIVNVFLSFILSQKPPMIYIYNI